MNNGPHKVGWTNLEVLINNIRTPLEQWRDARDKPRIVAIARGGLIPATILSHILDIPIEHVITAKTYTGQKKSSQTLLSEFGMLPRKAIKDCMFVDDILDTGGTFTQVIAKYPGAKFVVPIAKVSGLRLHLENLIVKPNIIFQDTVWVEFPWEQSF